MNQAPDRQVEELVKRLLEPRLETLRPGDVLKVTHEVFAQIVSELGSDRDRLHRASEAVVMCVARRWGNIVQAGKASVLASRDSAESIGITPSQAAELATLGAARGVRRVGPVAFSQLRNELCSLVDNFDELTSVRGTSFSGPREYPVIVPMEDDWDFPSAEESWEEELARVAPEPLEEPTDLSAWDFDPAEEQAIAEAIIAFPVTPVATPAPKASKSFPWLWLTLFLLTLAATGVYFLRH